MESAVGHAFNQQYHSGLRTNVSYIHLRNVCKYFFNFNTSKTTQIKSISVNYQFDRSASKHRPTVTSNRSCSTVFGLRRAYRWCAYTNWPTAQLNLSHWTPSAHCWIEVCVATFFSTSILTCTIVFDCRPRLQERQPTRGGGQRNYTCADNYCVTPAIERRTRPARLKYLAWPLTNRPALYENRNLSRLRSFFKKSIEIDQHWKKWDRNSTTFNKQQTYAIHVRLNHIKHSEKLHSITHENDSWNFGNA